MASRWKWSSVLTRACWLLAVVVLIDQTAAEPASTVAPSSTQAAASSPPPPKEKRSQEDIMFGNQQNKPASGMVDDFFQPSSETASKNASQKSITETHVSEGSASPASEGTGSEHRQTFSELPDRLDYYDYVQPESPESQSGGSSAAATEDEDVEEEDPERNSFFAPQEPPSFGSQKLLAASNKIVDRNELGDYAGPEEEYEGSTSSRRKRGVFRRLRSPLEDLLSPSGVPFRRRRASMRLKRDAASNELLNWLALLHRSQAAANSRRGNQDEIAFQEFQGLEPEPLDLSSDSAYLYEPLTEEELEEEGVPASLLESLPLPEEGPDGDSIEWDLPIRAPPRRRSFYPVDYRYLLLPGARKRGGGIMSAPGGHFGAMREVNRWPGEPQSGRWGHFPLLQQTSARLGLPVAVRRAQPQESDADRLYALASLLATPGVSSRDITEPDLDQDRRRRRRSPKAAPNKG